MARRTAEGNGYIEGGANHSSYPSLLRLSLPLSLQTDACSMGLSATLTQVQDGHERIITYASRNLNKAERNYALTEWECLAVVWAIRKYRVYLEGYHFTVVTDHSSLKWMYRQKNPVGRV